MENFIALPDGSVAFITGGKDLSGCEHSWEGEGLITFGNGETMTETEYAKVFENSDHYVAHFHNGIDSSNFL